MLEKETYQSHSSTDEVLSYPDYEFGPDEKSSIKAVDALVARDLNAMSLEEREALLEQIHGVDEPVQETEEFLQERLQQMQEEIRLLSRETSKDIYTLALQSPNSEVATRSFHLQFLRAAYYDPYRAAARLALFLEKKYEYFGRDVLGRPLRLSDLDRDDMAYLKSGTLQVLPSRDHRGRAVIGDLNMTKNIFKTVDNMFRTFFYTFCTVAEDEETQRHGVTIIFYFSVALQLARELHAREFKLFDCVPVRIAAIHFCASTPFMKVVRAVFMLGFGSLDRVKVRLHEGSPKEVHHSLKAFGLPVKTLPITYEGDLKVNNHTKWIQRRILWESRGEFATSDDMLTDGVDLPAPKDVLLGRGKTVQDHSGNLRLKGVVLAYLDSYRSAAKSEKNILAMKVVQLIRSTGGRFLKRTDEHSWWEEVDDETAREKVSMIFRASIQSATANKLSEPSSSDEPVVSDSPNSFEQ